jgi:hypothetical protein
MNQISLPPLGIGLKLLFGVQATTETREQVSFDVA